MSSEIRWRQRYGNFTRALDRLADAVDRESYSDLERAGLVQTFEFTFELAWKTLKDLMNYEGYDADSPREVIKVGFANGYIIDADIWLEALESRNVLTHTYDEKAAEQAVKLIRETYYPVVRRLHDELKKRL